MAGGGEAISSYPFYHFHPLHRHLDISWVKLGNIYRVLLNLFKRLIFLTFKDSSFLPMFPQLTFIFSLYLVHQLQLLLTLTFFPLPYLFGLCHDINIQLETIGKSLFTGRLRIALIFLIVAIAPFFQNLYWGLPLLL